MFDEEAYLMISGIQHFVFCRRQWALIHVENLWEENHFTEEGKIVHKRVHSTGNQDWRNGVLTARGLAVKSQQLGIVGVCDAVEFTPDDNGVPLHRREGLWRVTPVEYKRGSIKTDDCDRLQLLAQAMCLEEMFGIPIDRGDIFYHEMRRRERVEFTIEQRKKLQSIINEMHQIYERQYTPKVRKRFACRNCSLKDVCMPEIAIDREGVSVQDYIDAHVLEE